MSFYTCESHGDCVVIYGAYSCPACDHYEEREEDLQRTINDLEEQVSESDEKIIELESQIDEIRSSEQ